MSDAMWPALGPTDIDIGRGVFNVLRVARMLDRSAREDPAALRDRQLKRAAALAEHARTHVPLYRDLYGSCSIGADSVLSLPTVDRARLQAAPLEDRLSAPRPPGVGSSHTSGSTGEPLSVLKPPGHMRWAWALREHMRRARVLSRWSRQVTLVLDGERGRSPTNALGRVRRRARVLSSGRPTEELAAEVVSFRPAVLGGPGDIVVDVGRSLDEHCRPRQVVTGTQRLDPVTREAITSLFGRPPMDMYGVTEVGQVAWQCAARDLYHVNHPSVLVEVLDEGGRAVGPGGTGEVVLTGLVNPLMPILRYHIGDAATLADRACACGHAQPSLAAVDGRRLSWLLDERGGLIAPQHVRIENHVPARELAGVLRRYRVHQAATGRVRLELALFAAPPAGLLERLERSYRRFVPVDVVLVDDIPSGPGGKLDLVSSDCVARGTG